MNETQYKAKQAICSLMSKVLQIAQEIKDFEFEIDPQGEADFDEKIAQLEQSIADAKMKAMDIWSEPYPEGTGPWYR